jgi:SAM-dependent methyltransferase
MMSPQPLSVTTTASGIFNNLILGYIVLFFNKQDLFPEFELGLDIRQLVEDYALEETRLRTILEATVAMGVLHKTNQTYRLTELGRELARNRGFFTWAIGGYSPLLESMDLFLQAPTSSWRPYVRGDYVAIGSDECNQGLMQPIFDRVIDSLPATRIADLGCGNAGRLVELLERRPELTGVGIDIDPRAIELAQAHRHNYGVQDRLQLVCEDVFATLSESRPELADTELVMSFMMLHDLFNKENLHGRLFASMKKAFPKAKYFVLADTCSDETPRDADTMPIFTMGYELIHALRGLKIFPLSHYEQRFAEGGLKLVARHELGVPNTYLFVLEVPS